MSSPASVNDVLALFKAVDLRLKTLEARLSGALPGGMIHLGFEGSSLSVKRDGSIELAGRDIEIKSAGKVLIKAVGDITLKGAKINQN